MKKKLYTIILIVSLNSLHLYGVEYYISTHFRGIFFGQPTSARAAGMGLTAVTLGGVEHMVYNPAAIGLEQNRFNFYMNYAIGEQISPVSSFGFAGVSFRVNPKLALGLSRQSWVEKDSPWTTIIGGYEEFVEKSSQQMYTLSAAYEVTRDLQVGVSANYLMDKAVPGVTTGAEMVYSLGAVYDMNVDWIKMDNLENQRIRFAGSFFNLLMNNEIIIEYKEYLHYRDLPILLTLGTAYQASLPFNPGFLSNSSFFNNTSRTVDLGLHLQFREMLKGPEKTLVNSNYEENTSIGIGAEAVFSERIALRLGYFFENRPTGDGEQGVFWVTTNKRGLTFGYGVKIPVSQLTENKIPFDADLDLVTFKVLRELNTKNYTHPPFFYENDFLFAIGVKLRWTGN